MRTVTIRCDSAPMLRGFLIALAWANDSAIEVVEADEHTATLYDEDGIADTDFELTAEGLE